MDLAITYYSFIFIFLLFASAIFSGGETAFFSLNDSDKEELINGEHHSPYLLTLLKNPQKLLTTIVIGNTFVNIGIASVAAYLTHDYAKTAHWAPQLVLFLDIIVVTFVILVVSEILPKVIAVRKNINFVKRFGRIIWLVYWMFFPLTVFINRFVSKISSWVKNRNVHPILTDSELKTLMEYGEASGELDKDEKEMISSIFVFGETTVKEIIVPRTDMIAFNIRDSFSELISLIRRTHFSRIPVFDSKIDNIIGILYVKDLLPFMIDYDSQQNIEIRSLLRSVYFVPEQKNIDVLLKEFQSEKIHIAIVVDEYGGTAGLVTLEDILEEIVGEIQDEFDEERPLISTAGEDTWTVSGKTPLVLLEETLAVDLPKIEDVETVGGLILSIRGSVPQQGEEIKYDNLQFHIIKVTRQRIIELKVRIIRENENDQLMKANISIE